MDTVLIVCQGLTGYTIDDQPQPAIVGQYLASYDPEAHDGLGEAVWTPDILQARMFDSIRDAHACWTAVPANRPLRPDGEPNRPLTAFTVEFRTSSDGSDDPPGDD